MFDDSLFGEIEFSLDQIKYLSDVNDDTIWNSYNEVLLTREFIMSSPTFD